MLQFIKINNFLLFKNQEVQFNENFTVITGETGSGKSMLIKALRFVLGEKQENLDLFDSEISIVAQYKINSNNDTLIEILKENEVDLEDETLILRRTLGPTNKGKTFLNDIPVTLKLLKKVSDELVEFHSQHRQLEAFNKNNCLNIIDQYAKENILLIDIASLYEKINQLNEQIEQKNKEKLDLEQSQEYIEHSYKEIKALNLKYDEESELIEKKKLFNDKVKIIAAFENLLESLNHNNGIIANLLRSQRNISKFEVATDIEAPLEASLLHLNELQELTEKKLREYDTNESIEYIEERLSKIKELSRKHRCNSDQLIELAEEYQNKLSSLSNINQDIENITIEKGKLLKEYFLKAEILSQKRKEASTKLEENILKELKELKLEQVEFKIELTSDVLRPIQSKGINQARFLIKTNKGFSFAEINEIASGGELSRIMLAFKVALAEISQKTTIIFDEIDSGTGGATAQTIGNRMKKLAETNQIIAISHQPQVAAKANQHLLVKKSSDIVAQAIILDLNSAEKTQEIARMLAGINITDSAINAALSLIED